MPTPQQEQENLNKVNAVDESFIKIRQTLLIGLGGTGGDVLLRSDRDPVRLTPEQMERDEFAVLGVLADVHQGRPKIRPL